MRKNIKEFLFVLGFIGAVIIGVSISDTPPPKKYVNGHEIVTIGSHEYIREGGFWGDDLTHYEDCKNPIHTK